MPRRSPQTQERVDLTPGRPSLAKSGELPRSAAAELGLRRRPAAAPRANRSDPSDSIWMATIRSRADLFLALRSRSNGRKPRVPVRPGVFLKRPPVLLKSTRSPILFKNNYAEVLFLSFWPLSFSLLEPAIQACRFCELDPRVMV